MSNPRCILLLVQQPCLRLGLAQALRRDPEFSGLNVLEAGDPEAACILVDMYRPDMVIADISGARTSPVELARFTKCADVAPKVLVISPYDQPYLVQQAFDAKASGYLLSSTTAEELVRAVKAVSAGETYLDPALASRMAESEDGTKGTQDHPVLPGDVVRVTPREIDVLKRIAYGYSAKEIARDLDLSQKSVETYKARGASKLRLESRAQIVRFAHDVGWFVSAH